jgi:hypothetical protein
VVRQLRADDLLDQAALAVLEPEKLRRKGKIGIDADSKGLNHGEAKGTEPADFAVAGVEALHQNSAQPCRIETRQLVVGRALVRLGVIVGKKLVGQVAGDDERRCAAVLTILHDCVGKRGVNEATMDVEVAPVNSRDQHEIEIGQLLFDSHGRLNHGEAEIGGGRRAAMRSSLSRRPGQVRSKVIAVSAGKCRCATTATVELSRPPDRHRQGRRLG